MVLPEAMPVPITAPPSTLTISTVAPLLTPPTENVNDPALVILSESLVPVSLDANRVDACRNAIADEAQA